MNNLTHAVKINSSGEIYTSSAILEKYEAAERIRDNLAAQGIEATIVLIPITANMISISKITNYHAVKTTVTADTVSVKKTRNWFSKLIAAIRK